MYRPEVEAANLIDERLRHYRLGSLRHDQLLDDCRRLAEGRFPQIEGRLTKAREAYEKLKAEEE
jgi:hypothetical protein